MSQGLQDLPPKTRLERARDYVNVRWKARERWDGWHPLLFGLAILALLWRRQISPSEYQSLLKDVAPTAVSVAAILAGFQGTIHTILLSMRSSRVVRVLREKGHYVKLVSFVGRGVISLLLFVAVALAALAWNATSIDLLSRIPAWMQNVTAWAVGAMDFEADWPTFVSASLAGLFAYAMLASVRIIRLIVKLLRLDLGD